MAPAFGAAVTWNGSADDQWSNAPNWNGGTPALNDVYFNNGGAAATAGEVTSIVDQSYTINSLSFTNTQYHFLQFQAGANLNITGGLTIGRNSISSNVSFAGSGNSLTTARSAIINNGVLNVNAPTRLDVTGSLTIGYADQLYQSSTGALNLGSGAVLHVGTAAMPAILGVAINSNTSIVSATFAPDSSKNPDVALYLSSLNIATGSAVNGQASGTVDLTKFTGPLDIQSLNIGRFGAGHLTFGNATNNRMNFQALTITNGDLSLNANAELDVTGSLTIGYADQLYQPTTGSLNLASGAALHLGTSGMPASLSVAINNGISSSVSAAFVPDSSKNPDVSLYLSSLNIAACNAGNGHASGTVDLTKFTGPLGMQSLNIGGSTGVGHFTFGNPTNNLLSLPSQTITNGDIAINERSTLKVTNSFSVSSNGQLKLRIGGVASGLVLDNASTSALSLASGAGRITLDFGNPDAPTPEYYGLKWKGDHLADIRARLNQYGHTGDGTIRIETSGAFAARCPLLLTLGIENGFIYTYLGLNAAIPADIAIAHVGEGGSVTSGGTVDFGTRMIGIPFFQSFTLTNTATLPLSGITAVVVGANAGDFALSELPAAALVAGGSTPYTITFNGLATGPRTATLRITSSDTTRNPILIHLTALGIAPEIGVEQPLGTTLTTGVSNIHFGSVNLGSVSNPFVFTIRNTGSAPLSGIAIVKEGSHTGDFVVGNLGPTTVAPGAESTFTVTFSPGGAGSRSAAILIPNNDADESPFVIQVSGYGVPSVAKDMLTFDFEWLDGARIDGTFITLEVPYGIDVTALSPVYTISPRATCTPASGATRSFSSPQTYTVTAEDGTSKDYTVTVTILPPKLMIPGVLVGNPLNAPDPATGYGAVAFPFRMGRHEVSVSQYAAFLNAVAKADPHGLYHPSMATDSASAGIIRSGEPGGYVYSAIPGTENRPIAWVSWFDAARFANWLHNRQPNGIQDATTTEDGAYPLNGITSGVGVARNPAARFWIPSEDEWYKAAYYDATKGGSGGYWRYPTQSDTIAGNTIGVLRSANYFDGDYVGSGTSSYPTGNALTDGGAYGGGSLSRYGTADQAGNLWEWNDAVIAGERGTRGGCFDNDGPATNLSSGNRGAANPSLEDNRHGFRCAMSPLSDFNQSFPAVPVAATGGVKVWIEPAAVGGWRFGGELAWRPSGTAVSTLVAGDWDIEFRPVSGYLQPLTETLGVASGAITPHTATYYPAGASGNGSLSVVLKPDSVAAANVPVVDRAQWRLDGEGNADWKDSGETVDDLMAGAYVVEFKQIPGRATPSPVSIHVGDYSRITHSFTYIEETPPVGTAAEIVPFPTVSSGVGMPYAFVGQLRGSAGSGSGVVVRRRVVATAGHVVFDDNLLAAATGMQWLFQRDATVHEPKPQEPRGVYLFGGYAARRRVENTPWCFIPAVPGARCRRALLHRRRRPGWLQWLSGQR